MIVKHPAIGTVKGPGETPNDYLFIAPDPERRVKHGEFVYYVTAVDGDERQILGRVTGRRPVKLFPDSFLADPGVPPTSVAALLGYESDATELFEITVTVLGYHSPQLGDFINPRVPPVNGAPVYIADDELLGAVLSKRRRGERGSAHIGSLLSRPEGAVPIALDVRGFTGTHLAVIASTGSGKSYLAGVLLEEMLAPHNRAAVLVVDPHGEYSTLQEMMNLAEFSAGNYKPRVRIFRPDQLRVRIDTLTIADLRYLLPNLSEKMHYQLGRAFSFAQRSAKNGHYTLEQLLYAVRQTAEGKKNDEAGFDEDDPTTGALIWRLHAALGNSRIFHDFENLELDELFKPGQCTIIQLNEIDRREQQVIVATLLRRVYQARMDTAKGKLERGDPSHLPYPVFCLLEEAHNYAPANADAVSSDVLKTILSEGRKFGVGIGLITQRPGKLDGDVLSQCMTQCIMRITNPIDQNRIAESVESVGRDLLRELPSLSKGQVVVSGASVNTPVLLKVRKRITQHGGQDLDAPAEWMRWFEEDRPAQAERAAALYAEKKVNYEDDGDVLWA
ncbi:MAG TPA: ATP-binding protein [Chloroflexi bacterium]|nr:ATP-binding protein [Chloroflexota bacterium]HHW85892.1 ATP-binding protein [Chloroflexota bacterium]